MAHPGSQYSLSTQEMEMDYYDYNVINASAAPGSYLGMDPAFLVWIPPIDESGNILSDSENEEILPTSSDVDPGSNKESPESDEAPKIPQKPPRKSLTNEDPKPITSSSLNPKEILSRINFLQRRVVTAKPSSGSIENLERATSHAKPEVKRISQAIEKETSVIKSPSDSKISEYYELSDIKFADDEEEAADASFEDTAFQMRS